MNILLLYLLSICMVIIMLVSGYLVGFRSSIIFDEAEDFSSNNITSTDMAENLISKNNLLNVNITRLNSKKTNYYSASYNVIKLSPTVKDSTQLSALAISGFCANQARLSQKYSFLYLMKTVFSFISKLFPIIFIPLVLICAILSSSVNLGILTLLILIALIGTLISFIIQIIIFIFELKSTKRLIKDIASLNKLTEEELNTISTLLKGICKINFYKFTRLILKFLILISPDFIFRQN